MSRAPIIGIDLGTTNSVAAFADEKGPRVLTIGEGDSGIMPSFVRFAAGGGAEAVGEDAKRDAVRHPERTIYSAKRLMGRAVSDVAADLSYLAYAVEEGAHNTARIRIGDRQISAQEVSATILAELRLRAEKALGMEVGKAVVTVPAYFDDAQRQATRDAGRLAGLEVVRIVNEPTAAALAYGIGVRSSDEQRIVVFDLGGGTFDVSILSLVPGADSDAAGAEFFEVLSTAGDTHLGGDDVDQMIVKLLVDDMRAQFGDEIRLETLSGETRQALRTFAEAAKVRLSEQDEAPIRIDIGEGRALERTITRDEIEELATPWMDRALACCKRALKDAKLAAGDIDRVIMVGGSTRMPLVRRAVGEFFDVEPYTALDPDLVVAMGAAVQASIVGGLDRSRLLLDVIPLSLGVETQGGAVAKMIVRNQMTPARATEMFTTSVDGQTSIKLHILQGEREMVEDCRSLGEFHLSGLPPMPAGVPQLEVEFLVDANGVLNVSAFERRSGKRAALQVAPSHGLSREEVERMETESFAHAREDMTRHRIVDLIANSRLDAKWTREQLARIGSKMESSDRAPIESNLAALESLIEKADADWKAVDADDFSKAKEALDRSSVRMHEISIAESLRAEDTSKPSAK